MNKLLRSTLAAVVLLSLPGAAALAQPPPQPDGQPKPDASQTAPPPATAPPPSTTAPPATSAPPADKPPASTPVNNPAGDKPPSDTVAPNTPVTGAKPDVGPVAVPGNIGEGGSPARPFALVVGGFSVWPTLLVQTQVTPYVGQNASFLAGDIAERPGFRLRRARFGVGGRYETLLSLGLSGELTTAADASLALHEAWFGLTPKPWLGGYIGVLQTPFSRSAMTSAAGTALIDRPLAVRAMAPLDQLGALVKGSIASGKLQYSLGVFNGFERSDTFYAGYNQSLAALGNRFDNLAYAVRLGTSILSDGPEIPDFGDTRDKLDIGASYFLSDGGARDIHSVEGDALFEKSGLRFLAEALYSTTKPESQPTTPTNQTATIDSFAAVVEGGYTFRELIGGHVRFEWIDPNMVVQDNADNWLLTVGVSFMPPVVGQYVKAQLEYTHREEVHGLSLENDSVTLQAQLAMQ